MSAVTKTLAFFFPKQARQGLIPHATSGRLWLLRLGYFKLHAPLEQADDWNLFADHAVEIGKHRFLGVIGIRLSELPPPGECLKLSDMTPVALLPVEASNQETVHQQLETVVAETGIVPQAILSDEGSDLAGGIDRFCKAHPETTRYRDLPHMAARLLKKRLEKNERWKDFIKQVTQTKFETAQTELAFLVPPRLRSKARYMNLQSMLRWAEKALAVLDDPSLVACSFCSVGRLNMKFQWVREYRADVALWSSWLALTDTSLETPVSRRYEVALYNCLGRPKYWQDTSRQVFGIREQIAFRRSRIHASYYCADGPKRARHQLGEHSQARVSPDRKTLLCCAGCW